MKYIQKIIVLTLLIFNHTSVARLTPKHIGLGVIAATTLALGAKKAIDYFRDPATVGNAAEKGNILSLGISILLRAPLNTPIQMNGYDKNIETPLIRATRCRRHSAVKLLLAHGARVNDVDKYNASSLYVAMRNDDICCARELLKYNADTEIKGSIWPDTDPKERETPLEHAVRWKSMYMPTKWNDFALLLIENNAHVHPKMLRQAAACNKERIFSSLLQRITNNKNALDTALIVTCNLFSIPIPLKYVPHLINAGADVNASLPTFGRAHRTPLECAAFNFNTPLVKLLIARGARVNSPGQQHIMSRFHYRNFHNMEMLKVFLEAGIDLNQQRSDDGSTALIRASRASSADYKIRFKVIKLLLFLGADHTIRSTVGNQKKSALEFLEELSEFYDSPEIQDSSDAREYHQCLRCLNDPINISSYLSDDERKEFGEILENRIRFKKSYEHNMQAVKASLEWVGLTDNSQRNPLAIAVEYLGDELITSGAK